ncbi:hypothetical protein K438DRAFT_756504 [Mycena galopus ATCC 62051]|nr:hypothetical protein K438DRAFT_756504 [Mycena galopus ATCC 62051]
MKNVANSAAGNAPAPIIPIPTAPSFINTLMASLFLRNRGLAELFAQLNPIALSLALPAVNCCTSCFPYLFTTLTTHATCLQFSLVFII